MHSVHSKPRGSRRGAFVSSPLRHTPIPTADTLGLGPDHCLMSAWSGSRPGAMPRMEGSRAANTEAAHTRAIGARSGTRPTLWRLPLIAFLAIAVLCLKYLDGRLATDYTRSAADLAVQADALIERALEHHAASLHAARILVADASSPSDQQARLASIGRAITGSSPAVVAVYRLDARGDVVDVYPRAARDGDLARENHLLVAETAEAIARARGSNAPAATGVIVLRSDTLGLVMYDPIVIGDHVTGYVAAAVAYAPVLRSLLAPRLQGRFGYRITDGADRVLAVSPGYSTRVSEFATRTISLPGGREWRLDVPVGLLQPRAARVTLW